MQTKLATPAWILLFHVLDPIFFLHHANIDRIWWNWQQSSPSHLYEIGGPTSIYPPVVNLTYNFPLQMGNLGPTVSVGTILNIYDEPNCYTYVWLYVPTLNFDFINWRNVTTTQFPFFQAPEVVFTLFLPIYGIFDTSFSSAKRRVDVEIPPSFV